MRWKQALTVGAVASAMFPAAKADGATTQGRHGGPAELSVSSRLADRREVAGGTRAYSIGFEDGRFYANGWHITGEMGGVWTPPLKLLDGLWFGIDGQWAGQATKFTSGKGYTRYDLPSLSALALQRTDFVPDGRRAALFGLQMTNPGDTDKTVTVKVDARSELMGSWPWGSDGVVPNAKDNLPDSGSFDGDALVFRDQGTLPGADAPHDYTAMVASDRRPQSGTTGAGFWGAQAGTRCDAKATSPPSQCDDGPFGNGTGGGVGFPDSGPPPARKTPWGGGAGAPPNAPEGRAGAAPGPGPPGRPPPGEGGGRPGP